MEALIIEEDFGHPKIILNKEEEFFSFEGKSMPENPKEFYSKIIEWLQEYANNPKEHTKAIFKLSYFNTASSKRILDVLEEFKNMQDAGNTVTIEWHYNSFDEDMKKAGLEYSDILELELQLKEY
ncbi:MAG: nuclear pore complex subunit [Marinilabiliales bacterium]|nr:MAG: nuclear pore complex subunit [Marinilabiliales bacterium]